MVFPNPVKNGLLYVKFASLKENAIINIVDLSGRVVYNKILLNVVGIQQLDVAELNSGLYLVKIIQGRASYTKKIIIEN